MYVLGFHNFPLGTRQLCEYATSELHDVGRGDSVGNRFVEAVGFFCRWAVPGELFWIAVVRQHVELERWRLPGTGARLGLYLDTHQGIVDHLFVGRRRRVLFF